MGKIKRKYHLYTAWDYLLEIEELNRESMAGWQLIKGGSFWNTYEHDDSVRYRYQLDYIDHSSKNTCRYLDTFKEQGWEFINSTFNGWQYFRKKYYPELDESEYEIYTDYGQIPDSNKRWIQIATMVVALFSLLLLSYVVHMILQPKLIYLPIVLSYVITELAMVNGIRKMNHQSLIGGKLYTYINKMFFPLLILGIILNTIVINDSGNRMSAAHLEIAPHGSRINQIDIKYPDFYYIDLYLESDQDLNFIILDSKGRDIYSSKANVEVKNKRQWFNRGKYRIVIENKGNSSIKESISIKYNIR